MGRFDITTPSDVERKMMSPNLPEISLIRGFSMIFAMVDSFLVLTYSCPRCGADLWVFNIESFCYSSFVEPYETYPPHGFESLAGFDSFDTTLVPVGIRL